MLQPKAVVVGGGFTGSATAAAFSKLGVDVTVLEAAPHYDQRFRGELIHPKGVRALDAFGLLAPLKRAGGVDVSGFAVTFDGGRDVQLPYAQEHGAGLGIDHEHMVHALRREVASRRGVRVLQGQRVVELLREGTRTVGVKTEDGTEHRADLVALADGRTSRLREQIGLAPKVRLLSYSVTLGLKASLPTPTAGHVFLGAPGPVLAYPYSSDAIRFCVDLPLDVAKGRPAIAAYLKARYVPYLPASLREGFSGALERGEFDVCANHAMRTTACATPGLVMLGDAGGCAHPLTASGMTNAMNDVLTLARAVRVHGVSDAALKQYQRRRYDFVRMREVFTDALYEVFRGEDSGSKALQQGVASYWDSSERNRKASVGILSGEDVRLSHFVREYANVFGRSALSTVLKKGDRRGRLKRLAKTGFGRLETAAVETVSNLAVRYRRQLHEHRS